MNERAMTKAEADVRLLLRDYHDAVAHFVLHDETTFVDGKVYAVPDAAEAFAALQERAKDLLADE